MTSMQALHYLIRYGLQHRPDVGQYGACARCTYGNNAGTACAYPAAPNTTSANRSTGGVCGDGHLFTLRTRPAAQPALI